MATVHGSQILVSSTPHDGDSDPKATSPMRSLENISVTKDLSNPENRLESIDSTLQPMTIREQLEEPSPVVSKRHTLRVLTAFIILFSAGWGDGVTGVVLPYIKQQFQLSYTLSGVLFVAVSSGPNRVFLNLCRLEDISRCVSGLLPERIPERESRFRF
ncbi:hypothetical protein FRB91_001768, partial [Serendipita sp. 411]